MSGNFEIDRKVVGRFQFLFCLFFKCLNTTMVFIIQMGGMYNNSTKVKFIEDEFILRWKWAILV